MSKKKEIRLERKELIAKKPFFKKESFTKEKLYFRYNKEERKKELGVLKTQINTDDSEIRLINNKVENIFEQ